MVTRAQPCQATAFGERLERGEVVAIVTFDSVAVSGCDVSPLDLLRYRATASPDYVKRTLASGIDHDSLAVAPMLVFNIKDRLQEHWMTQQGIAHTCPPAHGLPSSEAFVSAALAGMGWGMNPDRWCVMHWIPADWSN